MKAEKKGPLHEVFDLLKQAAQHVRQVQEKEDETRSTRLKFLETLQDDVAPALDSLKGDLALNALGFDVFRIHPDPEADDDDGPDEALALLRLEEPEDEDGDDTVDDGDGPVLDVVHPTRWRLVVLYPDCEHRVSPEWAASRFRFDPEAVWPRLKEFIAEIRDRAKRSVADPEYARKSPEEKSLCALNEAAQRAAEGREKSTQAAK